MSKLKNITIGISGNQNLITKIKEYFSTISGNTLSMEERLYNQFGNVNYKVINESYDNNSDTSLKIEIENTAKEKVNFNDNLQIVISEFIKLNVTQIKLTNFIFDILPDIYTNRNHQMILEIVNSKILAFYTDKVHFLDPEKQEYSELIFKNNEFESINLYNANLYDRMKFSEKSIFNQLKIINFKFENTVKFEDCCFNKEINFENVDFDKSAIFFDCNFKSVVNFTRCRFKDNVSFEETTFSKNVKFDYCNFEKLGLFRSTQFNEGFNFAKANFFQSPKFFGATFLRITKSNLRITKSNKTNEISFKDRRESCRIIKKALEEDKNFIDAGRAYEAEMELYSKEINCWSKDGIIFYLHKFISNHSQSWLRPLVIILSIYLLLIGISFNFETKWSDFFGNFEITNSIVFPLAKIPPDLDNDTFITFIYIAKFFMAYIYYQFITAVRQKTRR